MHLNLLALALGIAVGYLARTRAEQGPTPESLLIASLALFVAIILPAWSEMNLGVLVYGRNVAAYFPIHSAVIGIVIGILLGDQQAVARLRQRYPP